jgi:glutathione S-transferase
MASLTLLIGDRATSGASLQAWLTMRCSELSFRTMATPSDRTRAPHGQEAPWAAPTPPVLYVDEVPIWDSLAIGEFLAEHVPGLWPAEARARALARSMVCELHGGLAELQRFLPLDLLRTFGPPARLLRGVERDLARVTALWAECRARHSAGGRFLFGGFTLADAMYAPVAVRLAGHSVPMSAETNSYVQTILSLPALLEWVEAARSETRDPSARAGAAPSSSEAGRPREPERETADDREPPPIPDPAHPASSHQSTVKPIGAGTRRRH